MCFKRSRSGKRRRPGSLPMREAGRAEFVPRAAVPLTAALDADVDPGEADPALDRVPALHEGRPTPAAGQLTWPTSRTNQFHAPQHKEETAEGLSCNWLEETRRGSKRAERLLRSGDFAPEAAHPGGHLFVISSDSPKPTRRPHRLRPSPAVRRSPDGGTPSCRSGGPADRGRRPGQPGSPGAGRRLRRPCEGHSQIRRHLEGLQSGPPRCCGSSGLPSEPSTAA